MRRLRSLCLIGLYAGVLAAGLVVVWLDFAGRGLSQAPFHRTVSARSRKMP